jgi:glycosyltransferase involved in cell wall biosynthesis
LVVNSVFSELNYLARALLVKGALQQYVRSYANLRRPWEKALGHTPGLKQLYGSTMGRRFLPAPLDARSVEDVAVLENFAIGILRRLARDTPIKQGEKAAAALQNRTIYRIQKAGARQLRGLPDAVVASYGVGVLAFRQTAARKVLDYPIAHHAYFRRFLAEEAEREPQFAPMLGKWGAGPGWSIPLLEEECELADSIWVGSDFARDSFITSGVSAEKVQVLPYGSDTSRFSPATEKQHADGEFRILFAGQIGQRKGISYLLKAYKQFQGPGTRLTLVGNPYGSSAPLQPYRDLFDYVPNVPQARLAEIFRMSDVFLFPTLLEGMPLVVLEAMASGLPVITTPNGPGGIVRDGIDGFIVPPRDVDAIKERLEYLRANPERRREMGGNARARALTYTWEAYEQRALEALGL